MQHDSKYPPTNDPAPKPDHPVAKASGAFGTLLAWALIGLVGVLVASGLLALIVMLWRVIL